MRHRAEARSLFVWRDDAKFLDDSEAEGTREQPCLVSEHVTSRHLGAHGGDWRACETLDYHASDRHEGKHGKASVIKMQRLNDV